MLVQCLKRSATRVLLLLALLSTAPAGFAELTVIFDNGKARPLSDFLGPLESAKDEEKSAAEQRISLGAADLENLLPIRSPGLIPGKLKTRKHNLPFARPFFLLGSDDFSKHWLLKHRKTLKELGAVGMLVEAQTPEDLRDIARLAEGLPMTPASGSDIGKALGITHYPFAISGGQIWQ